MITRMKNQSFHYLLLLFLLGGMMISGCKDPYLEPQVDESLRASHLPGAFPNVRPALALGAKRGYINTGPFRCKRVDSAVCVTLLPKLEIPDVWVEDFIDIPIGPDPCPYALSCPPFIPVITELADSKGNPLPVDSRDIDPMMVEGDFLFIQFNNPEDDALLSKNTYGLAHPITLDPAWAEHLGIEGNVINEGVYFSQYDEKLNAAVMAVPLKEIGYPKR